MNFGYFTALASQGDGVYDPPIEHFHPFQVEAGERQSFEWNYGVLPYLEELGITLAKLDLDFPDQS